MKAALWLGLLFSLLILGIGASWLSLGTWMTATVRPAGPPPIIPPGRENVVMTFLGPVVKNGFAGLSVTNISLEKSEIRLQLGPKADSPTQAIAECALPEWARAPGMLVIVPDRVPAPQCPVNTTCGLVREKDLVLVWAACTLDNAGPTSAAEWTSALAQRDHGGIWEMPRDTANEDKAHQAGLLTPIVSATGRDKGLVARMLLLASMVTTGIAGLVLRWRMGRSTSRPTARNGSHNGKLRWGTLGALVVVGIGLRVHAAATLPRDYDEMFNGVYTQKILCEDHDSWVHPPLYRAVNKAWFDTARLTEDDAMWKHRVPSVVFSVVALCLLALALGMAKLPAYAAVPFALAAMSPVAVKDSILARPYGLAMFGATLGLMAISSRDLAEEEGDDWFSWFVALVALGLTIWTDLVTSLLVGSFVLARWLDRRSFSKRSMVWGRTVIAVSIAVWAIPFALGLPGSIQASKSLDEWPFRAASSSLSAFQQVARLVWEMVGMYGFADQPGLVPSLFVFAVIVLVAVVAIRWTHTATAVGLVVMFTTLTAVSSYVAMRTRNAIFLPVAIAFVTSLVVGRAPMETIRETVRRR